MERGVRAADLARPLATLEYVVLDTETTGLDPDHGDRVVSLAGVKVRAGAVRRGETFDALVNPGRPIPAGSVRFHGITEAMVSSEPPIDVVLPEFLRFAGDAVLVGHQVWFDMRFLAREARRLGLPGLPGAHPVLDTLTLSEAVHGPLEGHRLEDAAARLGVTVTGRHSALGDALTTAEILVRLLPLLGKRGVVTLGEALAAARRPRRAPSS
jgi:DNA polymerase-3 subunit epsilon